MKPIGKSPSYLIRNPYSYCFRMVVPKDLQKLVGKRELRYSLKTGYLGVAKYKARLLAGQVQYIFKILREDNLKLSMLSDEEIQKVVSEYIRNRLEDLERVYYDGKKPHFKTIRDYHEHVGALSFYKDRTAEFLAMGNYRGMEVRHANLFGKYGIDQIEKDSVPYIKLCREILKADLKLLEVEERHLTGDYSYQDELSDIFPAVFPKADTVSQSIIEQTSEPLGEVVQAYWNENEPTWKIRSKPEIRRALDHFLKYFSENTQIHTIDYSAMRGYKEFLRTEEFKPGKTRAISTINDKYLVWVIGFFNYAVKNNYIEKSPAEGIKIKNKKKKKTHEEKNPFTKEDLKKLFCESKEYRKNKRMKPNHFWVPLIGLYTGMRREEICQLYVSDVKKIEGIWCLDVNEDKPDKSVKTSERRIVPLHDFLVNDLNFIGYVKSLPDQNGRVFPELKRVNDTYGHSLGNWFRRFRDRNGIVGNKSFHSFRHTLKTHLAEKDVQDRINNILTGHAVAGEISRYVKPSVKMLYEKAVKKIDYGIDLSHLKKSKFVPR